MLGVNLVKLQLMQDKDQEKLKNIISFLVKKLHPERIILFGSRARGSHRPGSDFDLAVEGGQKLDFRARRKLKEELEGFLGLHSLDLIFLDEVSPEFRQIIRKGVIVYEKNRSISGS
ncbi:nucleotidyltransferase family protein [Thermosulfurimonas sp. F29]|uniref:type VII toxin-antitoxin system MntA family adenylyltransferase antitoxin n=1 Tax=Thermosulfurimonas sp. F29 TaxID=2867247 RepID=UPI001C82FA20|nr:nucleotidyltransferase domain-containing protein [Thermosulfurimonas sp. F29]MBX6423900.1 nucleotidyltransferase domain-containing protein [Thermosulfurimonas sp. F29]